MTQNELAKVLKLHKMWLDGVEGGKRAYLSGAYLTRADLTGAYLTRADLTGAYLTGAYLYGASLSGASLSGADLTGAILSRADLRDANLTGANLTEADLTGAKLSGAKLPDFQLCPEGDFIGYKKVLSGVLTSSPVVLKLRIEGPRTSSLVGRKCRTSKAFVLEAINSDLKEFRSLYDPHFIYRVGEYVEEPKYNPDIHVECTSGIHFFMTEKEAKEYCPQGRRRGARLERLENDMKNV